MNSLNNNKSTELGGKVLRPGDPEYPKYAKIWNNRFDYLKPKIINVVENNDHITRAIRFVQRNGLHLRIKSGGHNYEGFSMIDNGFVLHLSKMKHLSVDRSNGTCTFGPGWLQEDLYAELKRYGVTISGGICPKVAGVPVALSGGTGIYHRKYGLTCDTMVGLSIIDHNGNLIECNKSKNADLFWACRGAGNGNFGVVTSITLRTFPLAHITNFRIGWKWNEKVPVNWQLWLQTASEDIGSVTLDFGNYTTTGRPSEITCNGLCFGYEEDCKRMISRLVALEPKPEFVEFWVEEGNAVGNLACGLSADDPDKIWSMEAGLLSNKTEASDRWKSTGLLSKKLLDEKAIKQMGELMQSNHGFSGFSIAFVGLGGKVKRPNEDTSYPHRSSDFMMRIVGKWNDPDFDSEALRYHENMKLHLATSTASDSYYFNYSDLDIDNFMESYFKNYQERLEKIKRLVDRNGFFEYEQSIPLNH